MNIAHLQRVSDKQNEERNEDEDEPKNEETAAMERTLGRDENDSIPALDAQRVGVSDDDGGIS